ncbi:MAG: carboxypeptidase regulatory-like domain-containing protein [Bacteroidota bacterium]
MKRYHYCLILFFSSLFFVHHHNLKAQQLTQQVRGVVKESLSGEVLPGALIRVAGSNEGAVSDQKGEYSISLPLGYHRIEISYLGYQSKVLEEILVTAGKEVVLHIDLEKSAVTMADANVTARALPVKLASRDISAEQVQRYAATFYDPVRLSVSLPAVSSTNDQNNNVSVRGTSPSWNQWRLEGLEIASPNHLTNAGTFSDRPTQNGGGVNILSAQMLSDSKVLYGGFNADRGNALGAIFDMNLRNGNGTKSYHTLQASLLGIDLSTEGPFSKNGKASYLVNYRYSFTGILAAAGVDFGGEEISFQDLSFNLTFPNRSGETKVFGLGGTSNNTFTGVEEFAEAEEEKDLSDIEYTGRMLAVGFKNIQRISDRFSVENALIYSLNHSDRNQIVNFIGPVPVSGVFEETFNENKFSFRSLISYGFRQNSFLKAGYNAVRYNFKISSLSGSGIIPGSVAPIIAEENEWLIQPFVNYEGLIGQRLKLEGGINFTNFNQSDEFIIEPRIYLERYLGKGQSSIYARGGLYSQVQSYITRYSYVFSGRSNSPNPELALNKAGKFQLGFLTRLGDFNFNAEAFYDHYYDIPFANGRADNAFGLDAGNVSAFNLDNEFVLFDFEDQKDAFVRGIDVSIEKRLVDKWYYLLGATYYKSTFEDENDNRFNSRWDGGYAFNSTIGKEIQLKSRKDKQRSLSMNARVIYQGGFRRNALNVPLTNLSGVDILDGSVTFDTKNPDYFRLDLRFAWRVQKEQYTRTLSFDLQNASNYENFASEGFDSVVGIVQTNNQLGIIPMLTYRVEF